VQFVLVQFSVSIFHPSAFVVLRTIDLTGADHEHRLDVSVHVEEMQLTLPDISEALDSSPQGSLSFFLFSVSTLHPLLLLRPLFGRQAARRPGVDGGDLGLERVVDQPVPGEERLLFKVWRHDDRGEGLAAPARHVLDRHVRRVQRVLEFRAQRLGRDAGRGRRLRRRRVGLRGHGG